MDYHHSSYVYFVDYLVEITSLRSLENLCQIKCETLFVDECSNRRRGLFILSLSLAAQFVTRTQLRLNYATNSWRSLVQVKSQ